MRLALASAIPSEVRCAIRARRSITNPVHRQRDEADLGIYYYNARWYDPYLNRFLSPDSIIQDPYNSLDWDRYSYARNNPVRYSDPSGHAVATMDGGSQRQYFQQVQPVDVPKPTSQKSSTWSPPPPVPPCLLPTNTPRPPSNLYSGPTNTPAPQVLIRRSNGEYIWVDWTEVDKIDMVIDIVGIAGTGVTVGATALGAPEVAPFSEGISDVFKFAGLIKTVWDLTEGDLTNMTLYGSMKGIEKLTLLSRFERMVPVVGLVGNFISLGTNIGPSIKKR